MLEIKIDKSQSDRFLEVLQTAPDKIKNAVSIALFRIAHEVRNESVTPPSPYKTGNLRRSVTLNPQSPPATLTISVGTNVEYGRLLDKGGVIPAHTIRPRRGKALRFFVEGKPAFAKSVRMPAQTRRPWKGRGWLTPAFKTVLTKKADTIMRQEIDRVLK